jgi:hypothetical protein
MMGIEILNPSTVAAMSILDTSIRMRGRNLAKSFRQITNCARFNQGWFQRSRRGNSHENLEGKNHVPSRLY